MVYQYQHRNHNPIATLGDFIWKKDKALSKDFCKEMIEKFDADDRRSPGRVGTGQVLELVKQTSDLQISNLKDDGWKQQDEVLFNSLKDNLDEYIDYCREIHPCLYVSPEVFNFNDTGYQIQRYEPEGFYEWHQDWTMEINPDGTGARVYTYIWYLNTIKKGDDGYTQFIDGSKVRPKAGRMIIFPAVWPYLHRAYPAKVRKYICTGWIYAKLKEGFDEKLIF